MPTGHLCYFIDLALIAYNNNSTFLKILQNMCIIIHNSTLGEKPNGRDKISVTGK